jgi:hypothetical protein
MRRYINHEGRTMKAEKIQVRLSTANICGDCAHCTHVYPYNYLTDYKKVDLTGKKKVLIREFFAEKTCEVQILWGCEMKKVPGAHQYIDVPADAHEMIFVLNDLSRGTHPAYNRVAEFAFELE